MNFVVYFACVATFLGERFLAQRKSENAYPYGQQNKAGPESSSGTIEMAAMANYSKPGSFSCAETHHIHRISARFLSRLDPSPVGVAIG
jgi:hypothetical protein